MEKMNHFDKDGKAVMVDVGEKEPTRRTAAAQGEIRMSAAAFEAVSQGTSKKGDVLGVARVAGILAAKRTSELIPLCHPIMTESVSVEFTLLHEARAVSASCTARTTGKTGVEMEALTGVTIALLTIYDMCKAIDRAMVIGEVCLLEKQGGKSGHFVRADGDKND